jgi:hypothetical protein
LLQFNRNFDNRPHNRISTWQPGVLASVKQLRSLLELPAFESLAPEAAAAALASDIAACQQLEQLEAGALSMPFFQDLCSALEGNRKLKSLQLCVAEPEPGQQAEQGGQAAEAQVVQLPLLPAVEKLCLGMPAADAACVQGLLAAVARYGRLQSLYLLLGDVEVCSLAAALQHWAERPAGGSLRYLGLDSRAAADELALVAAALAQLGSAELLAAGVKTLV